MSAPKARWPAFLLLLVVFLLWANSFIAARVLVSEEVPAAERLGPVAFVLMRFAPVGLFCLAWFALLGRERRAAVELLRRHGWTILVLAAVNVWGYNLAFGFGHHRVAAGTASLIIALNPVLTLLLAAALGQERISWAKALGLGVAFSGLWLVVSRGAGRAVDLPYLQDAAVLALAPVCWALYTVLAKPLLEESSPVTLTFLALGLGSLPTLPWLAADLLVRGDLHGHLAAWSAAGTGVERWGAALFLSLGCTLLAFWLWFEALKRLAASTAAAFVFLNPPLTLLFEWLWFAKVPSAGFLSGGALVLIGVYLATRRRRAGADLRPAAR